MRGPTCGRQTPTSPRKCAVSNPKEGYQALCFLHCAEREKVQRFLHLGGALPAYPWPRCGRRSDPHLWGAWDLALASGTEAPRLTPCNRMVVDVMDPCGVLRGIQIVLISGDYTTTDSETVTIALLWQKCK